MTTSHASNLDCAVPTRFRPGTSHFDHMLDVLIPAHVRRISGFVPSGSLLEAFWQVDDPAQAVIAAAPEAYEQVELALEHGIDSVENPHPAVSEFMATVDNVPDVVDPELLAEGLKLFARMDPFTTFLASYTFGFVLASFVSNSSAALAFNQRSVEDVTRRVSATYAYALDIFMSPAGYSRFGAGTLTASRLRMMHSRISSGLTKSRKWNATVNGAPISMGDTLNACIVPTTGVARLAEVMGYRFTDRNKAALAQVCLMEQYRHGVPEHLLAATWDDQLAVLYTSLASSVADVDMASTDAVLPAYFKLRVGPASGLLNGLIVAYSRRVFGDELSDLVGIPRTRLRGAVGAIKAVNATQLWVRRHVPLAEAGWNATCDYLANSVLPKLYVRDGGADAKTHYSSQVVRAS